MDHTNNQPTLVHAKFLVFLFKKGIELAGEMPETGEILMILLENHQPIESIWNFLVNICLFHLSISIPLFFPWYGWSNMKPPALGDHHPSGNTWNMRAHESGV